MDKLAANALLILIFLVNINYLNSSDNSIIKIFNHQGFLRDDIVFYFSNMPICNQIPKLKKSEKSRKELILFIPQTKIIKKEYKEILKKLETDNASFYKLRLHEVASPIKGLNLLINYDETKIAFEYDLFNDIHHNKKGIILKFHKKDILEKLNNEDIIKTYAFNNKNIILDFGHGGKDYGAIGHFNTLEKEINMEVGMKLVKLLKKRGFHVFLTRKADTFIPVDQRSSMANNLQEASIFISIHSNAALDQNASGIETFYSEPSLYKNIFSDLSKEIRNITQGINEAKTQKSLLLANQIQKNIIEFLEENTFKVIDRKVKNRVAQVLFSTQMPAVLIELGFLTNKKEAEKLKTESYQNLLAEGICGGIENFFKKIKFT